MLNELVKKEQCEQRRRQAERQLEEVKKKNQERALKHQLDTDRLKAVKEKKYIHKEL